VVGPLVKSQSLYLHSNRGNGYSFQANVNGLISCKQDEIMRVSIASLNAYNSFQQINETNDTIYYTIHPPTGTPQPVTVKIPHGNYPLSELASLISIPGQIGVSYNMNTNKMRLESFTDEFSFVMMAPLASILGFTAGIVSRALVHVSDVACQPHSSNEIVVNVDGLSPHENAAPVDNFSNPVDKIDVGHVIAVIPVGEVYQRTVWYNNASEFNSFFFSEKSVNTLRVRLTDMQGRLLTWMNNTTSISLLFQTYQIE